LQKNEGKETAEAYRLAWEAIYRYPMRDSAKNIEQFPSSDYAYALRDAGIERRFF